MANKKLKYAGKYPPANYTKELITKEIKKHKENIRLALKSHGSEVKRELRKVISTSVGNGRHYSGIPNRSSSPGDPPVSQSGRLEDGFKYKASPMTLKIGNTAHNQGAPYPTFLEKGTKKMKARPYFVSTILNLQYKLQKELQDLTK